MRRPIMIEQMFRSIANPRQIEKVNYLYNQNLKATALIYMLRKIRIKWFEMLDDCKYARPKSLYRHTVKITSGKERAIERW